MPIAEEAIGKALSAVPAGQAASPALETACDWSFLPSLKDGRKAHPVPGRPRTGAKPLSITDQRVLVLLDEHRVATTTQVSAALSLPLRTADYRLGRLREAGLVDRARPYRERGTAPFHWWLTRRGRALVHGEQPGRGGAASPHPNFLMHTAAVTGFALALAAAPSESGLVLREWRRDEEAWEHWREGDRDLHVAPDGLLRADAFGRAVAGFVEIDRGTMTQPRLRGKALRHLRYAHDRAWAGRHPWPPPLLFLTTSEDRARRLLDGVDRLRVSSRRKSRESIAFAWTGAARHLWLAACACVDEPERAVTEAVWTDASGARFTLAEGLARFAERQETLAVAAAAERARREAAERESRRRQNLWGLKGVDMELGWKIADSRVLATVRRLAAEVGEPGDDALTDEVAAWWAGRPRDGQPPMAYDLADALLARHARLWTAQAREVVALHDRGCRSHRLRRLAVEVAQGVLLERRAFDAALEAATAPRDGAVQAMAAHEDRRAAWVAGELKRLRPWQRKAAEPGLVAAFDAEHLWGCAECGAAVPEERKPRGHYGPEWQSPQNCGHCGSRMLGRWTKRPRVPTLEESLVVLRRGSPPPPAPKEPQQ